jgi:hypothetical protein
MNREDDSRGTEHVRMPVPPGGDADRHPGSPRLGRPDPDPDPSEGTESSGLPHAGRRHEVEDDEQLPGEWPRHREVKPPGGH